MQVEVADLTRILQAACAVLGKRPGFSNRITLGCLEGLLGDTAMLAAIRTEANQQSSPQPPRPAA